LSSARSVSGASGVFAAMLRSAPLVPCARRAVWFACQVWLVVYTGGESITYCGAVLSAPSRRIHEQGGQAEYVDTSTGKDEEEDARIGVGAGSHHSDEGDEGEDEDEVRCLTLPIDLGSI
jgi:hypothetical protein